MNAGANMHLFTHPETNIAPLEDGCWETAFRLGISIFRGYVGFGEGMSISSENHILVKFCRYGTDVWPKYVVSLRNGTPIWTHSWDIACLTLFFGEVIHTSLHIYIYTYWYLLYTALGDYFIAPFESEGFHVSCRQLALLRSRSAPPRRSTSGCGFCQWQRGEISRFWWLLFGEGVLQTSNPKVYSKTFQKHPSFWTRTCLLFAWVTVVGDWKLKKLLFRMDGFGRCLMPLIWKEEDQWGPPNEEFLRQIRVVRLKRSDLFSNLVDARVGRDFFGNIWLKFSAEFVSSSDAPSWSYSAIRIYLWVKWKVDRSMLVASYYCCKLSRPRRTSHRKLSFCCGIFSRTTPCEICQPQILQLQQVKPPWWSKNAGEEVLHGTSWIPPRLVCFHWDFVEIFVQG